MSKFFSNVGSSVSSFFYSLTTNDHYASYNSPFRSGTNSDGLQTQLGSSRGRGSNTSTSNPYSYSTGQSTTNLNNPVPYTPGLRSSQLGGSNPSLPSLEGTASRSDSIQLQDYVDGAPPAPPVAVSWEKIDAIFEDRFPELYENLSYPATAVDLNELENDLDGCSLPDSVRESYMIHDGQESGGKPAGVVFGYTLLDLEEISLEWTVWKRVYDRYLQSSRPPLGSTASITAISSDSAYARQMAGSQARNGPGGSRTRNRFEQNQESVPEGATQKLYCHPGWIPLVKDWAGNNIAVDLAPGPKGRWGQIILFGRDFDTKYVVAPDWASFLSTLADDLAEHMLVVDDEDDDPEHQEMYFQTTGADGRPKLVPYFEILKNRCVMNDRVHQKQLLTNPSSSSLSRAQEYGSKPTMTAGVVKRVASGTNITKGKGKEPAGAVSSSSPETLLQDNIPEEEAGDVSVANRNSGLGIEGITADTHALQISADPTADALDEILSDSEVVNSGAVGAKAEVTRSSKDSTTEAVSPADVSKEVKPVSGDDKQEKDTTKEPEIEEIAL